MTASVERAADGGTPRPDHAIRGDPDGPTILVIDNYDSFVYNLVQFLATDARVVVRRNDAIDADGIRALDPDGIVVSPGPGHPDDAGVSAAVFDLPYPALGVCLGHQALCAANGGRVERAPAVVHGKASTVEHDGSGVFDGLPDTFGVGRYHSLAVERPALPNSLVETAWTENAMAEGDDERSIVMGVRHRDRPHVGLQFHPESVLTGDPDAADLSVGRRLVANFCRACTDGGAAGIADLVEGSG